MLVWCIFDSSWPRKGLHSTFWDLQNLWRDFTETNTGAGRPCKFRAVCFGTWILIQEAKNGFKPIPFDKLEP